MKIKVTMLMLIMLLSLVSTGVVMAEPVSAATIPVPVGANSTVIQQIIDDARAGDTISFAPGTYTDIKIKINKTLHLVGNGAIIYGINETDTTIFKIVGTDNQTDASGSTVKGFEFYLLNNNVILPPKNKTGSSGYAVELTQVDGVTVSNITSHDGKAGVYNGGSTNTLVENSTFTDQYMFCYAVHIMGGSNITVRGNTISGAMDGVSMASSAHDIFVDNNTFLNNDYAAFWGGGIYNIVYSNNLFDGFNVGLSVEKAANLTTIINNTFINGKKGDAIYIMNSGAHGPMSVISDIEIINNLFKDILGAAIGIDKPGYFHGDESGSSIVGVNNSVQNVSKGYVVLYGNSTKTGTGLNFTLDSKITPPPVNPLISITSSISSKAIKNGDSTLFTVKVKNTGDGNATNVKVADILKTNFFSSTTTFASIGTYSNGAWNIGKLGAGDTASLVITATAKKAGKTSSQAKVTADGNVTANSTTITKNINKYVKLSYSNSVSSTKVKKGKYVYLTTKATNSGKDASDSIKIKMTLPGSMKVVSTTYPGAYNKNTKTWTYKIPKSKTYTFKAKVKVTTKGTKKVTFSNNGKKVTKTIKGY